MDLKDKIRVIPDFPKPGIRFKDITTLLADPDAFRTAVDRMLELLGDRRVDIIVTPEARGFIFGSAMAYRLGAGLIPVRKRGKLPWKTVAHTYELEYGEDTIEMHEDAVSPGSRVLIVDDLLATGGTVGAVAELVRKQGGDVVGAAFLIELTYLPGREKLEGTEVLSLIKY